MKRYKSYLASLFIAMTIGLTAQDKQVTRAHEEFESKAYHRSIASYEKLVKKGNQDYKVYSRLGHAHYLSADYETAAQWYKKTMAQYEDRADNELLFRYAQSLKTLGDYEASDALMAQLEDNDPEDIRAKKFQSKQDYLKEITSLEGQYEILEQPLNSVASDFAPAFYKDGLVFASGRKGRAAYVKADDWSGEEFFDLWMTTKNMEVPGSVQKLSKRLNTRVHESSPVFSKNGDTIYFTRNNSRQGKFQRGKGGVSHLKIYRSVLENGVWQRGVALPFNGEDFSVANPALSPDGKTLYFSSNMPGSYGQSDIFKVAVHADGSFGEPVNLGSTINTESRETFPFLAADGALYFASDGHPGLGGLDLFKAKNNSNATYKVVNLGAPINSTNDDFSLIVDATGKNGYFASNREGGRGHDDIYSFTYLVKEEANEEIVADPDTNNQLVNQKELDPKPVLPEVEINLEAVGVAFILFDFDRYQLTGEAKQRLDQIVAILNEHHALQLNISTHTDSRGNQRYNQHLSEKRLMATITYLMDKGVDSSRLHGVAMGESQLKNRCGDGSACNKDDHAQNRRSEFTLRR